MKKNELKNLIFKELGISEHINIDLLNGRTPFIRKYSRLNTIVDIINTIHEENNIENLKKMLEEISTLNKDNRLEAIKSIDLQKEIKEEYCTEYNCTATKYSNLTDKELANIDGIELFDYKDKKFIVLNGAPFRFLGRSIFGNGCKQITSSDFTESAFGSLISNIRPNRWSGSEFDIFDEINSDNLESFGAADAQRQIFVKENIVSPELLQRCVSSETR